MLSIQKRYTPTASKVDNDKQIPQLLLIVLSSCSTIAVLQQAQESAVVITSRNKNSVATLQNPNDVVLTNSNDVVTVISWYHF
ncbi:L-type lectin-domain containing receptor kinase IX.1-like [Dorcoceras hygrometricum]|uniref:L-type lectin-domain containing receptor kinase IX.1-like n=1 Tax=Dorcoceras hygrometricum TaxID=472368 RepID=A0A2Z7AC31_9LAMI|nr:L-type lectin-domain containing receptor kinase IX.1-like [Dorcoceras hygrometricum]